MKACYKEQMRAADRDASEKGKIPSILLMEHAALSVLYALPCDRKRTAIFCGKGNNAGDGFALARLLLQRGESVHVYLVCGEDFSGDCQVNYEILRHMDARIIALDENDDIGKILRPYDCVVDAIYGTGVHGTIEGLSARVIRAINAHDAAVVSVDVPSGMDSNTGAICGVCVKAGLTVTFAAYKIGMFLYPAADYTGCVIVADIGIPKYILEKEITVTDKIWAREALPTRADNSHKGDYGKVLVIGGSVGMTGAPTLAARAALTAGCGIVTAAAPESLNTIMEVKLTEEMTLPLLERDGHFACEAAESIVCAAKGYDAVLFGVGIGRSADIGAILAEILKKVDVPVIIDADGLYALAQDMSLLKNKSCEVILTPHMGEMARLTGKEISESEKPAFCRDFAREYGVTLVLKGHYTIVTSADGRQYINNVGNSGMATAGSGDVLGGVIASLAARMTDIVDAAALGVYLHGTAGDFAAADLGADSVRASSLIDKLPEAICAVCKSSE